MTDIGKLLNLQPLPDGVQLVNVNKIPQPQYDEAPSRPSGAQCTPVTMQLQFHPNSDY